MIPTFYKMGHAQTTGELPCKDEGLATPDFPASRLNPIPTKSNLWPLLAELTHSNPHPISFQQLFIAHPDSYLTQLHTTYEYSNFGPSASPADPPIVSSSHESKWDTVAHWETNGTDLSHIARPEKKQKSFPATPRSIFEE